MTKERLFCLDALRGIDMIFLSWFRELIVAVLALFGDQPAWLRAQFNHPPWGGFTAYDQIMPCFIFMCGAAVPLALRRFLDPEGRPTRGFYRHIAGRFVLLWVLGLFTGPLMKLDVMELKVYSNTLQAIAAGYVIASFVFLIRTRWIRFAVPFVLAGAYTLLLAIGGDMTPTGNFAYVVDQWCLSAIGFPAGAKAYGDHYTWFLTTLMFGAMTVWGANCTEILKSGLAPWKKAGALFAFAAGLTAIGFVAQIWIPCIKQIYTLSFVARSMGVCVALLAALYVVTDIGRLRRGWWLVTLFGQHALAAYLACNAFWSTKQAFVMRFLDPGVKNLVPANVFPILVALGSGVALTLVVWTCRRMKIARSVLNAKKRVMG